MRIIHCAPFTTFTKVGASLYSIPVKISTGLVQNGYFVHNFDYRDTSRYLSFFRNKKTGQYKMNSFFKKLVDNIKPDLIMLGHAELILEDTLEYIKKKGIKIVFWFGDVPMQEQFYRFSPFLDFAFSTAGGGFVLDMQKHVKNSFFIPNLVDKNCEKYRSFENTHYKNDVLVISRYDASRKEIFDLIKNKLDSSIKRVICGQTKDSIVIGDEYLKTISDSKIILNPNRDFTLAYDWYTSDRLMHILGNGGFALSTPMIDSERFFEDKLQTYNDAQDLKNKIDYFLNNDKQRRKISKWLWLRTHELFSAKRVTRYLMDVVEEKDLKEYEWIK